MSPDANGSDISGLVDIIHPRWLNAVASASFGMRAARFAQWPPPPLGALDFDNVGVGSLFRNK